MILRDVKFRALGMLVFADQVEVFDDEGASPRPEDLGAPGGPDRAPAPAPPVGARSFPPLARAAPPPFVNVFTGWRVDPPNPIVEGYLSSPPIP